MPSPFDNDPYVWQDREIRFDLPLDLLLPRRGEVEIDSIDSIEDTKGNNGERGVLVVTNLRIIWSSMKRASLNLSIGYNAVISLTIHTANSRLRGNTQALYVLTKFGNQRFEFIFTNLVNESPRLFTTVQAVFKAYDTSRLYRDLKLRGAVVREKNVMLLPREEIVNKINGAWNLSSDQGNLGTLVITNVRVIWFADLAENFNASIPYLQIKTIKVRDSKFGAALVIETTPQSGKYVLGFRIDPVERLKRVYNEVSSLHKVYSNNPIFGIEFTVEEKSPSLSQLTVERKDDNIEIVGDDETADPLAVYYADGENKAADREPEYNPDLGLAIEKLRDGYTIEKLWTCIHKL